MIVYSSVSHERNCFEAHWDNLEWDKQNELPVMLRTSDMVPFERLSKVLFGFSHVIKIRIAKKFWVMALIWGQQW